MANIPKQDGDRPGLWQLNEGGQIPEDWFWNNIDYPWYIKIDDEGMKLPAPPASGLKGW